MSRSEIVKDYVSRGWVPFGYASLFTPPVAWQNSTTPDLGPEDIDLLDRSDNPLAILLGKPSGIVVIDVDPQNSGTIKSLTDRYGVEIKDTRVVSTPSGGWHLYYAYPTDVERLPRVINAGRVLEGLDGIDFLADASHVIAPPTARTGHPSKPDGAYRVRQGNPVAPLPAAILADWLAATEKASPHGGTAGVLAPARYSWATRMHAANLQATDDALPGERDTTAFSRIASSVRLAKAVPDSVLSVDRVAEDYAGVSYEIRDLTGKIARATEFAEAHPWETLEPETLSFELPDSVAPEDAWEFYAKLREGRLKDVVRESLVQERIERDAARVIVSDLWSADEFLASPIDQPEWLVDGVLHNQGKVLLAAQYKAGKSTMTLELVRALTSGTPFLGSFRVPTPKTVAYFDLELGEVMLHRWMSDVPGINRSRLRGKSLLGRARELDTRSDALRNRLARQLREAGADVLIIDPLSPLMSTLALDENKSDSVRPLLDSFDALSVEAGLSGLVVTHHAGHENPGRARGSTAFMDWPSAIWNIRRSESDSRSFSAAGRDVMVTSRDLVFDPRSRALTLDKLSSPFDTDGFLTESRGTAVTIEEVGTALSVSEPTAKRRLEDAGWTIAVPASPGRNGAPALWEYRVAA